jgi:hypothetical protein
VGFVLLFFGGSVFLQLVGWLLLVVMRLINCWLFGGFGVFGF